MSRPPFVPFAPALDVFHPRDVRSPAMKMRCKRGVELLLGRWTPRGRADQVAWRLLEALALPGARRLAVWNGAAAACRVLGGLAARFRAEAGGEAFAPPEGTYAPPPAIAAAEALFDEIFTHWPHGGLQPGRLAWALEVAALDAAWDRFGLAAAAELAGLALAQILPPNPLPPRHVGEARA